MAGKSARSSRPWRERLLVQHGADVSATLGDTTDNLDDMGWARVERRQYLEVVQSFDPDASLTEELLVRLVGDTADTAAMKLEWEGILKPLQDAVSSISDGASLELAGFSKGSSVLHFRAAKPSEPEEVAGAAMRETPLAEPVRQFIAVVDAVENERDVRPYSASTMLDELQRLSTVLQRCHLQADFRFYAKSGDVRGAKLSERGMNYIKALAEQQETESPMPISGRITELRESGHVKVKTGSSRRSPAFDVQVDSALLTNMRLVLGETVHWRVNVVSVTDQLGRSKALRFEYLGELGSGEQEDLAPDANFWIEALPHRPGGDVGLESGYDYSDHMAAMEVPVEWIGRDDDEDGSPER